MLYVMTIVLLCNTAINECETGAASCAPDATCIDTIGSFECVCNEGFQGDGRIECLSEYIYTIHQILNHL